MDITDEEPAPRAPHRPRNIREDGWPPDVQALFIEALIEEGSVRVAARHADRHVTSAYRLRTRDPKFAAAWDAARRMAYARLRDVAIERAMDGTPQEVWREGEWIGMKRVKNDRLLMALLNHLKHEWPANAMVPRSIDEIEDRHSDALGAHLEAIAPPPEAEQAELAEKTPADGVDFVGKNRTAH